MEKIIEIPEGYEARIEDNKVILEPKESEDEKIRKSLIKSYTNQHPSNFPTVDGFTREQILAWLEKQGEQNLTNFVKTCEVEPKFKVGDVIRNKWSNRTKTIIAIDDYQYTIDDGMPAQPFKVNINEQDNWELVEQNTAWSEEDEGMLNSSISFVEHSAFTTTIGKGKNNVLTWLKSLKERYTWKPSEEQMRVLEDAKMRMSLDGYGLCPLLQTLINDLKKLKG